MHTRIRQLLAGAAAPAALAMAVLALTPGAQAAPEATPASAKPLTSLPYTPGLDLAAMDRTADPCVDFYQYACGGWIKNNPIPADEAGWDVYSKLRVDNQRFLWGILADLAGRTTGRSANQQKIGDYFAACMDEAAAGKLGAAPLEPTLARIAAMGSTHDLPAVLAQLQLETGSGRFFFAFAANQDFADATAVIAFADAGGLSLPDRDYYTDDVERYRTIRGKYTEHVARMFTLLGETTGAARQHAETVLRLETALARASLTRVERRDPQKLFHKLNRAGLQRLTPGFDWAAYLRETGTPDVQTVNVTEPKFLRALGVLWSSSSLEDLKTYLRWHAVHAAAPHLSAPFVNEDFAFFRSALRGVPALEPRWKRCVDLVDGQLGEALGQEFVARAFPPAVKVATLRMTTQIEQAMGDDIRQLSWMSEATKTRALQKLAAIANKIGYPDHWRDYSAVVIRRDDYAGNVARAARFESHRRLAKIGKPVDRAEWDMTPPTVNAGYEPQMNDITFPAGVLEPPLYDAKMDEAPNYGNTGGTIGHELTHGFDDEGRQFDAHGNLKDWWSPADSKQFDQRAQCIVDQYAGYVIVDDIHINSRLTLGEDIADLGGLILAELAWRMQVAGKSLRAADGLSPEQRFFIGYAQWACENTRPDEQRVLAKTDPHSPGKYRVNGVVANVPEFGQAFACHAGQPMVRKDHCRVW